MELMVDLGVELRVLHVAIPTGPRTSEAGAICVPTYVDQPQHEWPAWQDEFVSTFRRQCGCPPSVPLGVIVASGLSAEEILKHTEVASVDLILIGWHGNFRAQHARTLKRVIRDAPCPVLIVRIVDQRPR